MNKIKVVSLIRVSTEDQAQVGKAGLDRQRSAIECAVNKYDLDVINKFELTDVSGTNVINTNEVKEIINLMKDGRIAGVVVADIDRLIRADDFRQFSLLQDFIDNNCIIYLPEQTIDLASQNGFLAGSLSSIMAGNELQQIKKRMMAGKEVKRKNGKCPNSKITLPQGVIYDRELDSYKYDNDISNKIKVLFDLFEKEGIQNFSELSKIVGFSNVGIKNILQNKIYIGIREYKEKRGPEKYTSKNGRQSDRKKIKRLPAEIITIKVIENPLISEEQFERVQKIIHTKNRQYFTKKQQHSRFTYAGFLRCGCCGEKIYPSSGGNNQKKDYYICRAKKDKNYLNIDGKKNNCSSKYYKRSDIDYCLDSFVSAKLITKEYITELIEHNSSQEELEKDIQHISELKEQIIRLQKKRDKLIEIFTDGLIEKEPFILKSNKIDSDTTLFKSKIDELHNTTILGRENIYHTLLDLLQYSIFDYEFWTVEDKQTFLRACMNSFTITNDGITDVDIFFSQDKTRMDTDSWPPPALPWPEISAKDSPWQWSRFRLPGAGAILPAHAS